MPTIPLSFADGCADGDADADTGGRNGRGGNILEAFEKQKESPSVLSLSNHIIKLSIVTRSWVPDSLEYCRLTK